MLEKIEWYREVLELEPSSKLFFPLSRLLTQLDRVDEAITSLRRGVERHPEFIEARLYLVELLYRNGNVEECEKHLSQLTGIFTHYPGFWEAWGACLDRNSQGRDLPLAMFFLAATFRHDGLSLADVVERGLKNFLNGASSPNTSSSTPPSSGLPDNMPGSGADGSDDINSQDAAVALNDNFTPDAVTLSEVVVEDAAGQSQDTFDDNVLLPDGDSIEDVAASLEPLMPQNEADTPDYIALGEDIPDDVVLNNDTPKVLMEESELVESAYMADLADSLDFVELEAEARAAATGFDARQDVHGGDELVSNIFEAPLESCAHAEDFTPLEDPAPLEDLVYAEELVLVESLALDTEASFTEDPASIADLVSLEDLAFAEGFSFDAEASSVEEPASIEEPVSVEFVEEPMFVEELASVEETMFGEELAPVEEHVLAEESVSAEDWDIVKAHDLAEALAQAEALKLVEEAAPLAAAEDLPLSAEEGQESFAAPAALSEPISAVPGVSDWFLDIELDDDLSSTAEKEMRVMASAMQPLRMLVQNGLCDVSGYRVGPDFASEDDGGDDAEEHFSLRTRSMAEVLAEQGDMAGAFEIYNELLAMAGSAEEKADLQSRLATLSSHLDKSHDAGHFEETAVPQAAGKQRLLVLLEGLAERIEARAH